MGQLDSNVQSPTSPPPPSTSSAPRDSGRNACTRVQYGQTVRERGEGCGVAVRCVHKLKRFLTEHDTNSKVGKKTKKQPCRSVFLVAQHAQRAAVVHRALAAAVLGVRAVHVEFES